MFYHLLYSLRDTFSAFNVFQYITFRTAMATVTALLVALLLGPGLIRPLRLFQIGQEIREEGPSSHQSKRGTPTMGGLLVITAIVLPTAMWADLSSAFVWIAILASAYIPEDLLANVFQVGAFKAMCVKYGIDIVISDFELNRAAQALIAI